MQKLSEEKKKPELEKKTSDNYCIVTSFMNEEGNISAKRFPNSHKIN